MMLLEQMKELTQLRGISGREEAVREYLVRQIEGCCDGYETDNMGNLIVRKKGKKAGAKRVLFSAHMDEVGFIVTHITKEGMLHFEPVGGVAPAVAAGGGGEAGAVQAVSSSRTQARESGFISFFMGTPFAAGAAGRKCGFRLRLFYGQSPRTLVYY